MAFISRHFKTRQDETRQDKTRQEKHRNETESGKTVPMSLFGGRQTDIRLVERNGGGCQELCKFWVTSRNREKTDRVLTGKRQLDKNGQVMRQLIVADIPIPDSLPLLFDSPCCGTLVSKKTQGRGEFILARQEK